MNCPLCGTALAERGFFCKSCAAQVRCKACRELLEVDAAACVECGTRVGQAPVGDVAVFAAPEAMTLDSHRNTLSYEETKNNRIFSASLTDIAIQGLGDSLGGFLLPRGTVKTSTQVNHFTKADLALPAKPGEVSNVSGETKAVKDETESSATTLTDRDRVLKLFHADGENLELKDNRLKAKSQSDFCRRLTYLFLYAHELHGRLTTSYDDLRRIHQVAKVWDANTRTWLGKRVGFTVDAENRYKLTAPGREDAIKALNEASNPDVQDDWNPDKKIPRKLAPRKKA